MKKLYRVLWKEVNKTLNSYEIDFNKISFNDLKRNLSAGEEFLLFYIINKDRVEYKIIIHFWRLDIIPELKKKYKKETYVLGIEKGDARWQIDHENLLIDERHEFHKVEEIINYLDKKGYLKREEWIKDEK